MSSKNHLLFPKFIATNNPSMSSILETTSWQKFACGVFPDINNYTVPILLLFILYGMENPPIWSCGTGKLLSIFVSVVTKVSNIPAISTFGSSNFEKRDFLLRLSIITLFIFWVLFVLILGTLSVQLQVCLSWPFCYHQALNG